MISGRLRHDEQNQRKPDSANCPAFSISKNIGNGAVWLYTFAMTHIILITLIGALVSIIIGSIWYSDKTPMGRLHMRVVGFDKLSKEEQLKLIEEVKPHMWKSFLGQFILSAMTAFFIAVVSVTGTANGLPFVMAIMYGAFAWICFIIPVIGSSIIWGNVDRKIAWKKFFFDSLSYMVTIGAVLLVASLIV